MPDIVAALDSGLPPARVSLLRQAGVIAERHAVPLYLVGGCVRDLILRRPVLDLDLLAEGDGPALADRLAADLGGKVTARSQFGTAKLTIGETTLDVASARTETYPQPGALPRVQPGSLVNDLKRRDFAVNAIAVRLSPARFGDVVDPFDGVGDLFARTLRVLHRMSFIDDATRILRGVRYEARLGFLLDVGAEALARRDVRHLDAISPDRLRHELDRLFHEPEPERCLARAHDLGALSAILPGLAWPSSFSEAVAAARRDAPDLLSPDAFLLLLSWPLTDEQRAALTRRLKLPAGQADAVRDVSTLRQLLRELSAVGLATSSASSLLRPLHADALRAAALALDAQPDYPGARARLLDHLHCWRALRPHLSAVQLLALGVPQGPLVGWFLERLRDHRLDDPDTTVEQERNLVVRWLAEASDNPTNG